VDHSFFGSPDGSATKQFAELADKLSEDNFIVAQHCNRSPGFSAIELRLQAVPAPMS